MLMVLGFAASMALEISAADKAVLPDSDVLTEAGESVVEGTDMGWAEVEVDVEGEEEAVDTAVVAVLPTWPCTRDKNCENNSVAFCG